MPLVIDCSRKELGAFCLVYLLVPYLDEKLFEGCCLLLLNMLMRGLWQGKSRWNVLLKVGKSAAVAALTWNIAV